MAFVETFQDENGKVLPYTHTKPHRPIGSGVGHYHLYPRTDVQNKAHNLVPGLIGYCFRSTAPHTIRFNVRGACRTSQRLKHPMALSGI